MLLCLLGQLERIWEFLVFVHIVLCSPGNEDAPESEMLAGGEGNPVHFLWNAISTTVLGKETSVRQKFFSLC